MKSVDTNVLARFVVGDDPAQSARAAQLLQASCFIADTVLLETAWLLGSRYAMDRASVAATLRDLIDLPSVSVGDADGLCWAIERFAAGADFADMLHLHGSRSADAFVTFDQKVARVAAAASPLPIETL
ncbi:MAG: type II toxin-antitoxin system VapC family toxin [Sphingomonas sp.]|jgi:predicted nucleic-acid-binding protein|uniref:type II toxin-antitoxin system VapC family toxin n=1 Tax=Sphingomonas sp. TaxID=28214 RepID=UPI0025F6C120|nr:type II toxin-antitoxin system VapC family toxin [Sphingomonas sp.]MBX9881725.1 type II toxin-antitoxin system VapC family toxin [Sphingomonas sp.]